MTVKIAVTKEINVSTVDQRCLTVLVSLSSLCRRLTNMMTAAVISWLLSTQCVCVFVCVCVCVCVKQRL